jgi:hypothetical protein
MHILVVITRSDEDCGISPRKEKEMWEKDLELEI